MAPEVSCLSYKVIIFQFQFFIYSLYQSYNDVRKKQKFKIEATTIDLQQIKGEKLRFNSMLTHLNSLQPNFKNLVCISKKGFIR